MSQSEGTASPAEKKGLSLKRPKKTITTSIPKTIHVGVDPTVENGDSKSSSTLEKGQVNEAPTVEPREIEWMLQRRPLASFSFKQLAKDIAPGDIGQVRKLFADSKLKPYVSCLAWPGVATRYAEFAQYLTSLAKPPSSPRDAFVGFAAHLGRVHSYRALALSPEAYRLIEQEDSIWPTGRIAMRGRPPASAGQLEALIDKHGVWKVSFARLFISLQERLIGPWCPSLSLHDDAETALIISGGYVAPGKLIHLFEMNVPVIETLGIKVIDLHVGEKEKKNPWFAHRGCWFDAGLQRTERYLLYEIPFLKDRCTKLEKLTAEKAAKRCEGFIRKQAKLKAAWDADQL